MVVDILVLGATGFTGKLVAKYLATHHDRSQFTFGLAGRSEAKLSQVKAELSLGDDVPIVVVDITKEDQVQRAVEQCRVVLSTAGPYYTWGKNVVAACVRQGKHYIDLSGELPFMRRIIHDYDFLASKTHAVIIPASGFDSIPSDIAAFLSARTLRPAAVEHSTSALRIHGGISGGTLASGLGVLAVPAQERRAALAQYSLCTAADTGLVGALYPGPRLWNTLPNPFGQRALDVRGGFWFMAGTNKGVVQRTWALHQLADTEAHESKLGYGSDFKYEEFLALPRPRRLNALLLGLGFGLLGFCLWCPPLRWLLQKVVLPKPGEGPSEKTLQEGFLNMINIASSAPTAGQPQKWAKTTIKGTGDPGYSLTAVMIVESALALALEHDKLPGLGKQGGVLTPMSGLGEVLIERLKRSGRFEIESAVLVDEEDKKTR